MGMEVEKIEKEKWVFYVLKENGKRVSFIGYRKNRGRVLFNAVYGIILPNGEKHIAQRADLDDEDFIEVKTPEEFQKVKNIVFQKAVFW